MRVHNRFGGMRDLAYFEGEIRDASLTEQEREGNRSFRQRVSSPTTKLEAGCQIRDYAVLRGRDAGLQSVRNFIFFMN